MDKIKNSLIIAAYVLMVTIFFFGGYALGSSRIGGAKPVASISEPTRPPAVPSAAAPEPEPEKSRVEYKVIIQNGRLCLLKEKDGFTELISSEEISENIYPSADIAELKKGIIFDSMEKAQELFENFVS